MNLKGCIAQNLESGEVLHFKSLTACARYFNTRYQYIYQKIMNGTPTRKGWVFDYEMNED